MTEFLLDNLLLLPFLFVTYLVLEMLEARAEGALERGLGRTRRFGPLFGALAGVFPQCGFSAAAASLYAGGAITAGAGSTVLTGMGVDWSAAGAGVYAGAGCC